MSELPNKDQLYGRYQEAENWRHKLHRKVAHKSLDIPEDDDVYVDNSSKGMGWKELAVIAGSVLGGLGIYAYASNQQQPVQQPVQQPAPSVTDSEYEVRFYDQYGNMIEVPHISTKE